MQKTLYLIRHAEGKDKIQEGILHCQKTTALSSKGIEQCQLLKNRLLNLDFNVVYSANTIKSIDTAKSIAKIKNLKPQITDLLNEIKEPENQKISPEKFIYSKEEDFEASKKRAIKFLETIQKNKNSEIVAVTHSAILKMITACALFGNNIDEATFNKFKHIKSNYTGITILKISDSNKWQLFSWNDYSHLQNSHIL